MNPARNISPPRPIALAYAAHWHNRLAVSVRFEPRGDWVPGFVGRSALMRGRRPASRPLTAGLRRISLLVPRPPRTGFGSSHGNFAPGTPWEWPSRRNYSVEVGNGSRRPRGHSIRGRVNQLCIRTLADHRYARKSYEQEQDAKHNSEEAYYEHQRRRWVFLEDGAIRRCEPRSRRRAGQFPHPVAVTPWRKAANSFPRTASNAHRALATAAAPPPCAEPEVRIHFPPAASHVRT